MERSRKRVTASSRHPAHFPNAAFDVVALAASAGGLSALSQILASLPADFPATIVVVQHLDPRHRRLMADILSRYTSLQVKQAEEGNRLRQRVKIYATDVDEDALTQARQAMYHTKAVSGLLPELLSKYFEGVGTPYVFRSDLRRAVIFGRHDLIQDAPIPRLDLVVCRNTLTRSSSFLCLTLH